MSKVEYQLRDYKNEDAQIRHSGLMPRLGLGIGSIDARAALPLFLIIVHFRLSTFIFLVITMVFFGLLEFLGLPINIAFRRLRQIIVGRSRYVQQTISRRRRMVHG